MRIFTGVFNPIAHDGRVLRATGVLAGIAEVELICPSGAPVPSGLPYRVHTVDLPKGFAARFLEHLVFWWAFVRAARRFRPDVVYVHDHYLALAGALAAWLGDARLVYDAHELSIPESGRRMAWQDRAKYLFDRIGVRCADLIISTGSERANAMRRHYDLATEPLVIRNIAEHGISEASAADDFPAEDIRGDANCLFVYEGHVTLERGIQVFIEAMQYLPSDYHLLIVGGGPHVADMQAMAAASGLTHRIRFTGRVSRGAVQEILRHCDIGLVSYAWEGLNNLYCAPNKIFEYAHANLPMVATAQPTLHSLVRSEGVGLLVEKNASARNVAGVMQAAFHSRIRLSAAIPAFLESYSWEKEAERLRHAFNAFRDVPERP